MKVIPTPIDGLLILEPKKYDDPRGFFMETWREEWLTLLNTPYNFIQDNHARSEKKGIIRGLHYQKAPHSQGKLIWVTKGQIFDIALDLRKSSPTYGQCFSLELSAKNTRRLFIPRGFAHGYMTMSPVTEVQYKTDSYYAPGSEAGVFWKDPDLKIDWPQIEDVTLSDKDRELPRLKDISPPF